MTFFVWAAVQNMGFPHNDIVKSSQSICFSYFRYICIYGLKTEWISCLFHLWFFAVWCVTMISYLPSFVQMNTVLIAKQHSCCHHNKLPPLYPPWPRPCWQPNTEKCVINDRGLVISAAWLTDPTTRLHRSQSTPSLISTHYYCGHTSHRELHLCSAQMKEFIIQWDKTRTLNASKCSHRY